jgi:hypothetical protein
MTRNLYDVGDRHPDEADGWLNEKQEKRARFLPVGMVVAALAIAIGATVLIADILPSSDAAAKSQASATIVDQFAPCDDIKGDACVLSADAYAWRGRRYHLSDIDVPSEVGAGCPQKAALARKARAALMTMMNGGAFEALPDIADTDPSSRILLRDGVSIGQLMILKHHAKPWSRNPTNWCAV